jgi:protein-L-isoaspartate(D-aspartate) O-methyltransferase
VLLRQCKLGVFVGNPDFSALRVAMVSSQLRTNAITNADLIAAIETIPREAFVPVDKKALAYVDIALPLGNGRAMPAPLATARLIQELGRVTGQKILLIGAGTGYSAALLAEMGAVVTAVESDSALVKMCRQNLSERPVSVIEGALADGSPAKGGYDILFIDGAVDHIPASLTAQLKEGARIATGLVESGVTRVATGKISRSTSALLSVIDMELPVLLEFSAPPGFEF